MEQGKKRKGRRNTDSERKQAEELFVNAAMSQEQIAALVGVAPKTMSNWVNRDNGLWKQMRAATLITASKNIQMWHLQIYNLNNAIKDRPEGQQYPSSTEADTLSKMATNIAKLSKDKDLSTYIQVMDEFIDFFFKQDMELAKQVAPYLNQFARAKAMDHGRID